MPMSDFESEAKTVLRWMVRRPDLWAIALAMEPYDHTGPLSFSASTPEGVQLLATSTGRVESYFANALFGPCPFCLYPVVAFPDGRCIDWPSLYPHVDLGDEPPAERVPERAPLNEPRTVPV